MNLLDKIIALKNKFIGSGIEPQDVATIDGWMVEAKRLLLLQSLKGHDGIKYVLEIFRSEISRINGLLQNSYSKDLKDSERDRLLDKRDLAQKYLNLFDPIESELSRLEEIVDKEN